MTPRGQSPGAAGPQAEVQDALIRLDAGDRILSKSEADALVQRIYGLAQGGGFTEVQFLNSWHGELSWARNRVSLASDRRTVRLEVRRGVRGVDGSAETNQLDPASLEAVVRAAERSALLDGGLIGLPAYVVPNPELPRPNETIWSEATNTLSAASRGGIAQAVIEPAEAKGMLAAGYLEVLAHAWLRETNYEQERFATDYVEYTEDQQWQGRQARPVPYTLYTHAQCSMTVRDQQGTGSGWTGLTSFDWGAIDAKALGARALEKGLASRNPVALEPGRYTVILEPQAVADLLEILMVTGVPPQMSREVSERNPGRVFSNGSDPSLGIGRSKLGLKVADERVTISHDPSDPQLGILPEPGLSPITWIKNGVLTELGHSRQYALEELRQETPAQSRPFGYRMSGGTTSVEEMIQGTKRGLLITRFYNVVQLQTQSLLSTGLTRDGLWLIENGQITKAVKNLRFTESPMFVLNSIEQLGVPVPVFRDLEYGSAPTPAIVPPLKVRDFSFTSVADAV